MSNKVKEMARSQLIIEAHEVQSGVLGPTIRKIVEAQEEEDVEILLIELLGEKSYQIVTRAFQWIADGRYDIVKQSIIEKLENEKLQSSERID